LLAALLVVLVRSDVNEVLPPVECVLGDGGIATLVTTFSVPSVPENIHCTTEILEMGSTSMQRRPRQSSFTKIKSDRPSPFVPRPTVPPLIPPPG
jgi:hypothetical protein